VHVIGAKTPEEAFDEGMRRFEAGDLERAARSFERALALDPRYERALYQLGNVRQDQERWADAEGYFRASLALAPDHAEAHNNLGVVLQMLGRPREAETSYARAAELKPGLVHPWLNLSRMLDETGRRAEAIAWLKRGVERSAEPDALRHALSALVGEAAAGRAPEAYVRNIFDGFAAQFDHRLVEALEYRVPEAIAAALAGARAFTPASADVLDLGCGTGLSGLALRGIARSLTGVDLAPKMLEQARSRSCYDALDQGELLAWMRASVAARFDVIVAADVLIYIGALEDLFAQAARISRARALFAFSIEVCEDAEWKLQQSGRYAQSPAYVRRLAAESGFTIAVDRAQSVRKPVVGRLFVLARD
jgi:predicted TPR repeat methyltransferase